ncbi:hypothetical protein OG552_11090 [Streptomyces sp. NBC_01476]|uniref:putative phage holin n=1 Tax=Streptomyces sp. NBC_01476 TaxID=2903881 RepID=UPI002E34920D|nr:hypothetical protein [Streptomyces sp. NBC_01476]
MGWAQWVNVAGSGLVALASLAFVVAYAVTAPWWRSLVGRHVMAVTAAMGWLGMYTVLITVWPGGAVAAVLRVSRAVVILALAGLLVQRTVMVVRTQLGKRKTR